MNAVTGNSTLLKMLSDTIIRLAALPWKITLKTCVVKMSLTLSHAATKRIPSLWRLIRPLIVLAFFKSHQSICLGLNIIFHLLGACFAFNELGSCKHFVKWQFFCDEQIFSLIISLFIISDYLLLFNIFLASQPADTLQSFFF